MKRILALLLVVTLFMTLMPAGMAEEMATESVYKTYFSSEYPLAQLLCDDLRRRPWVGRKQRGSAG